jgi:prepilin-type N-terminal cleavage/methylation domain-containing protein
MPPAPRTANRPTTRSGFTLLELLLVIGLIGLLAAFAWPEFSNAARAERLIESARRMETLVAMCRAEAMNEGRQYRIEVAIDGSVGLRRQLDPVLAPHIFERFTSGWAQTEPLLDNVWIEAVQILEEGPLPVHIIDEELQLPELELDVVLTPVEEFQCDDCPDPTVPPDLWITFKPDGSCNALRWLLRDTQGRARLQTLDARLGRVNTEAWQSLDPDEVLRPEPLEDVEEDEEQYDLEDFEWRRGGGRG